MVKELVELRVAFELRGRERAVSLEKLIVLVRLLVEDLQRDRRARKLTVYGNESPAVWDDQATDRHIDDVNLTLQEELDSRQRFEAFLQAAGL